LAKLHSSLKTADRYSHADQLPTDLLKRTMEIQQCHGTDDVCAGDLEFVTSDRRAPASPCLVAPGRGRG
jgi:hypothetical protein